MLLEDPIANTRSIAILTRNPLWTRLLCSILSDWKFTTVADPAAAKVLFIERGLELPEHNALVVWLSPMPLADEAFLTVPVSLTELYHLLEQEFFPTPRRHIRVTTEVHADLYYGGDWHQGRLISLSDRGGRFFCKEELPRQTALQVEMTLGGRLLRIDAEVLYCVSAGDSPGRQEPQIGVLFKPTDYLFDALRRFIEKSSVEAACLREGIALSDPCVSWIEYAADPWAAST